MTPGKPVIPGIRHRDANSEPVPATTEGIKGFEYKSE